MTDKGSITHWIEELQQGDSLAPLELWNAYYSRLVALARKKLGGASRRMADEEDVVAAAFECFCRGAAEGRFPKLNDRDDLWQILVMLTARKAVNQIHFSARKKRGGGNVRGESVFDRPENQRAGIDQVVGSEPTPEFAQQITEEFNRLLEQLAEETLKRIAVAKMDGFTNAEIAKQLGVQTRTIERKLRLIREIWNTAGAV